MKLEIEHLSPGGQAPSSVAESIVSLAFRRLVLENAEAIGRALVDQASKGHCNAANLLLEFAGIDPPARTKPEVATTAPRIFLLELVDKLMLREPAEICSELSQDKTEDDRRRAASLKGRE